MLWCHPVEYCSLVLSGYSNNLDETLQSKWSGGSRCCEAAEQGHQETWGKLYLIIFLTLYHSKLVFLDQEPPFMSLWSDWTVQLCFFAVCCENGATSELLRGSCDFPHSTKPSYLCCGLSVATSSNFIALQKPREYCVSELQLFSDTDMSHSWETACHGLCSAELCSCLAWEQARSRAEEKGDFKPSELCCTLRFLAADFIEGEGDQVADLDK